MVARYTIQYAVWEELITKEEEEDQSKVFKHQYDGHKS